MVFIYYGTNNIIIKKKFENRNDKIEYVALV